MAGPQMQKTALTLLELMAGTAVAGTAVGAGISAARKRSQSASGRQKRIQVLESAHKGLQASADKNKDTTRGLWGGKLRRRGAAGAQREADQLSELIKRKKSELSKMSSERTMFPELMEKVAKLNVSRVERDMGFYANDKDEAKIRDMISAIKNRSFVLKHPWLTGIPTLGIAPAIAEGRASKAIVDRMVRRDPDFKKRFVNFRNQQQNQRAANYAAETERLKATQAERATRAAGQAAASVLAQHQMGRKSEAGA